MTSNPGKKTVIEIPEVSRLVAEFHRLPRAAQEAAWEAQRQRLAAALTARCEHGRIDFEQCPDCRARFKIRL